MARIGIFGWGVVAPSSPDVDTFTSNLESSETWLTPSRGRSSNFLVGAPASTSTRTSPGSMSASRRAKFPQLRQKMGNTTKYAIGAFIQALGQNPGIEQLLQELGADAQIMGGNGTGRNFLPGTKHPWSTTGRSSAGHGSGPTRSATATAHGSTTLTNSTAVTCAKNGTFLRDPATAVDEHDVDDRRDAWNNFWLERSDGLAEFLRRLEEIESVGVSGRGRGRQAQRDPAQAHGHAEADLRVRLPRPALACPSSTNVLWNNPQHAGRADLDARQDHGRKRTHPSPPARPSALRCTWPSRQFAAVTPRPWWSVRPTRRLTR